MIFIGSLLLICFPLGNGRSLTEKRELPLKETIVPTPGNGSFQSRKFMETLSHRCVLVLVDNFVCYN